MLDGGLRRPPRHSQCRRLQRFLKPKIRLFAEPLRFEDGALVIAAGFTPTIDPEVLAAHELACERFIAAARPRTERRTFQDIRALEIGWNGPKAWDAPGYTPPIATEDLGRSYVTPSLNAVSGQSSP